MTNQPSNSTERNPYPCRKCGKTIYWHKAQSGKNYPWDSATDRKAFHKCEANPNSESTMNLAQTPKPLTPDYFDLEPTVEERVAALEKQVLQLTRTIQAVEARQPIGDSEVPF
jgi:hypothetical protein